MDARLRVTAAARPAARSAAQAPGRRGWERHVSTLTVRRAGWATIVAQEFARDGRLGYDTRGVGLVLSSYDDGYVFRLSSLPRQLGLGSGRWRRIRDELRAAGYLVTTRMRGPDGRLSYITEFCAGPAAPRRPAPDLSLETGR